MPATRRTSRRAESRQPLQSRPVAKADIIILSSDDESSAPKKPLAPKKNINERTKKAKRTPIPISAEILEISSEDEGQNPMSSQTLGLEQLLKEANQEIERLKQKLQQCATSQQPVLQLPAAPATARDPKDREITRLQEALTHSQHAERKTKATIASLDEHVSCEICTCKIWVPYTLHCGHTFCETCLQDWFTTILAQHMNAHPGYEPRPPVLRPYFDALRNPHTSAHVRRQVEQMLTAHRAQHPPPQYTCPSCRVLVKSKPTEVFVLKHVVHTVAAAQGESPPNRLQQRATRPGDGPWDGFFPEF